MNHIRTYEINDNHIEQVRFLYPTGTVLYPNQRQYMGYNELLSKGSVKHIRLHTYDNGNFPAIYTFNGIAYITLPDSIVNLFTISLAKRNGDYHFIDMPIINFLQGIQSAHHIKQLLLKINFSKSYVKFVGPATTLTSNIAIIFYMDLYGQ